MKLITKVLGSVALVFSTVLGMGNANATTVLVFGQSVSGSPVTATDNGTQTTISVSDLLVNLTTIQNILSGVPNVYFDFTATSTGSATNCILNQVCQRFSGSFSFNSLTNGLGINYLSGTFQDSIFGSGTGLVLTASSATPSESVDFLSDVITTLGDPRAISLSFADVSPPAGICGTTTCGFTSSVSGTFSANAVPEPGSLALAGLALLGLGLGRRLRA